MKKGQKSVTLYVSSLCPYCMMAKMFLKKHKIRFLEKNVELDLRAAKYVISKTKQYGVPVVRVGNTMIVGYDEHEMKKALGI